MPDERSNYDKGVEAGRILQILKEHDMHFKDINGSQERAVQRLDHIELLLQQIIDLATTREASSKAEMKARDEQVITVRDALREKAEAAKSTSEQKWTPWQRLVMAVTPVIAIAGIIVAILLTK